MKGAVLMFLFVGLGNPGPQYENNRHNVGFMAIDVIAHAYNFPSFSSKHQGLLSQGQIAGHKVFLLKPQTFMNLSGQSVRAVADYYKIPTENIIVFHDELDIAHATLKVKKGGGHGGHNGLRNIAAHLGLDFYRVRLGIDHPGNKNLVHSFVLQDFGKRERDMMDELVEDAVREIPLLLDDVISGKTSTYTTKLALRRKD